MEMHLRLDEMSSSKELQKKVEAVMAQLDEQLEMIGEYTNTVEEMVPASKADITGDEDFGEVVDFLTKYVTVIERQLVGIFSRVSLGCLLTIVWCPLSDPRQKLGPKVGRKGSDCLLQETPRRTGIMLMPHTFRRGPQISPASLAGHSASDAHDDAAISEPAEDGRGELKEDECGRSARGANG